MQTFLRSESPGPAWSRRKHDGMRRGSQLSLPQSEPLKLTSGLLSACLCAIDGEGGVQTLALASRLQSTIKHRWNCPCLSFLDCFSPTQKKESVFEGSSCPIEESRGCFISGAAAWLPTSIPQHEASLGQRAICLRSSLTLCTL